MPKIQQGNNTLFVNLPAQYLRLLGWTKGTELAVYPSDKEAGTLLLREIKHKPEPVQQEAPKPQPQEQEEPKEEPQREATFTPIQEKQEEPQPVKPEIVTYRDKSGKLIKVMKKDGKYYRIPEQ